MPEFTFSLDEDELKIWRAYAERFNYSFDHLIQVVVPKTLTAYYLYLIANPEVADDVIEAVINVLPEEATENFMLFFDKMRERTDPSD